MGGTGLRGAMGYAGTLPLSTIAYAQQLLAQLIRTKLKDQYSWHSGFHFYW